jgi:hypothetical protein
VYSTYPWGVHAASSSGPLVLAGRASTLCNWPYAYAYTWPGLLPPPTGNSSIFGTIMPGSLVGRSLGGNGF